MSRRGVLLVTWLTQSCSRESFLLARWCRPQITAPRVASSEQQAVMLSAGETGHRHDRGCHAQVHDGNTAERAVEDDHCVAVGFDARCWTARHVCLAHRAAMETCCEHVAGEAPVSRLFAASLGGTTARPHRADPVLAAWADSLRMPKEYADMERHVAELYDWVEAETRCRTCAQVCHPRCGLLVSWGPATTLDTRQRAMPACRTIQRTCVETRDRCGSGRDGENEASWSVVVRSLFLETYGRQGGEGTQLLRDLVTTAVANGQLLDDGGPSWRECCLADMFLRALERSGATCCWDSSAADRVESVQCLFIWRCPPCLRLSHEGSSDRDRDRKRGRQRQTDFLAQRVAILFGEWLSRFCVISKGAADTSRM